MSQRRVAIVGAAAISQAGPSASGLGRALVDRRALPGVPPEVPLANPKARNARKMMSRGAYLAAATLGDLMGHVGWSDEQREAAGYFLGVGASGGSLDDVTALLDASLVEAMPATAPAFSLLAFGEQGLAACNPLLAFQLMNNFTLAHGAILEGLGGPNGALFSRGSGTTAALVEAVHAIRAGDCDCAVAGGADAATHPVTLAELTREGFVERGLVAAEGAAAVALAATLDAQLEIAGCAIAGGAGRGTLATIADAAERAIADAAERMLSDAAHRTIDFTRASAPRPRSSSGPLAIVSGPSAATPPVVQGASDASPGPTVYPTTDGSATAPPTSGPSPASTAPASTAPGSTAPASTAPASTAPGSSAATPPVVQGASDASPAPTVYPTTDGSATAPPTSDPSPVSTAPASTAPASTAPASTAPASTAPASTAPASTAPASTAPASETPVVAPRASIDLVVIAAWGPPAAEAAIRWARARFPTANIVDTSPLGATLAAGPALGWAAAFDLMMTGFGHRALVIDAGIDGDAGAVVIVGGVVGGQRLGAVA